MTINQVLFTKFGNYHHNNVLSQSKKSMWLSTFVIGFTYIKHVCLAYEYLLLFSICPVKQENIYLWFYYSVSNNDLMLNQAAVAALGTCKLVC